MRTDRVSRPSPAGKLLLVLVLVVAACDGDQGEPAETSMAGPTTTDFTTSSTSTTIARCRDAFCVEYHIHPDATWADGTPVTGSDFAFTFETIVDPQNDIEERSGYDRITGYEVVDEKTVLFSFAEEYGPWQSLFSTVLPRHVLQDQSINTVWDEAITMGSGPFEFYEWTEEESIVLKRNPNYWSSTDRASGLPAGDVQELHFVFVDGDEAMVDGFVDKTLDVVSPLPESSMIPTLEGVEDALYAVGDGTTSEYVHFNHDDPLLSQKFIRQAIAQGIDRRAIVEELVHPIAPDAEPLGNSVWLQGSASYEDHFNHLYPYRPAAAEQLLIDNGCLVDTDGVYLCSGRRLVFGWSTTASQAHRDLIFEVAQQDLAEIGIEVFPSFAPESEILTEDYIYGDSSVWQIMNLARNHFARNHFADPSANNSAFYCVGDSPAGFGSLNFVRYCNEQVDDLIRSTDTITDPGARSEIYNQADALYLEDIAVIPLYQRPTLLAWNGELQGLEINASIATNLWNVGAWSGRDVVTIGIEQGPASLQILEPGSAALGGLDAAAMVVAPILQGAFALSPSFEYEPVLVESVELIVSGG